jgi:hypothetical protein
VGAFDRERADVSIGGGAGGETDNVTFTGSWGEARPTSAVGGGSAGLEYNRGGDKLDVTVNFTGVGSKESIVQQRANSVANHAVALAGAIAKKLQAVWQDGTSCVTLGVTPASKSVKPQDKLTIEVTASAKQDGSKIARPISAKLAGPTSIEPTTSPSAPGSFTYTAPAKKGDTGRVTFEQRSKRGIGRAEVEYVASDKFKFDLGVIKLTLGCRSEPFCDETATLTGLSATIELGDDGSGTGNGVATLFVSEVRRLIPTGRCSVANSYQVPMTISVKTLGNIFQVSAQSNPKTTIQECGVNGPTDHTFDLIFSPVQIPESGGTNSHVDTEDGCFTGGGETDVRCTFTVTATRVD